MGDKILTLDPGAVTAGWAVWELDSDDCSWDFLGCGYIELTSREKKTMGLVEKCCVTASHVIEVVYKHKIVKIYCEKPSPMLSTARGVAAADDIMNIMLMIGIVTSAVVSTAGQMILVPVRDWKGCLPKDVCHRRIVKEMLGRGWPTTGKASSHAMDAVGIGLYLQGAF